MEEKEGRLRLIDVSAQKRSIMRQTEIGSGILEACRHGDREAFQELFEVYKDRVYSIALHYCGDEAAAKDISQQVFLKLFTEIKNFRAEADFNTWLYRIVANTCIDERRKTRRFVPIDAGDDSGAIDIVSPGTQEERLMQRQVSDSVQGAISQLKPKLRLPILLKYVEGLSYHEIAGVLGITPGTVASRLNRGHQALARALAHLRGLVDSGK